MDSLVIKGVLLGLTLSFMVGPLLFAIVQAGIERGFRAGFSLAAGIWVSDLIYIFVIYHSVGMIEALIARPHFKFWTGLAGGLVLIAFGLGALFSKSTPVPETEQETTADRVLDRLDGIEPEGVDHNWKRWGYFGYWLRGFLLNTINPFTIFFWLGLSSAVIIPHGWTAKEALWFFTGMLSTLIATDTLKAYAAKRVRRFLTPGHVMWVQRGIGITLIIFGIAMFIRVM
jgi:threonine/homoserine/homoserine lactone efflux protein